jgi:protein SCO1/2
MKRAALILCAVWALAAERHPATAIVLKIDRAHRSFEASCQEIPGYMAAMVMPFSVREEKELDGLAPGTAVDFTLVAGKSRSYAEAIRVHKYEPVEQEPLRAHRLQLLQEAEDPSLAPNALKVGQTVPDFALTDQTGARIAFSQFAGKVVGIAFIYTSCPLPDYCVRLSNNFGRLDRRFAERMGRDLILLTITFDPVHDDPKVMAQYARRWKADAKSWHFLTGTLPEVKAVCQLFGLSYWQDEGWLTHSLHTIVVDRQGKLAANFEGNEFTAEQLGDFVSVEMAVRK